MGRGQLRNRTWRDLPLLRNHLHSSSPPLQSKTIKRSLTAHQCIFGRCDPRHAVIRHIGSTTEALSADFVMDDGVSQPPPLLDSTGVNAGPSAVNLLADAARGSPFLLPYPDNCSIEEIKHTLCEWAPHSLQSSISVHPLNENTSSQKDKHYFTFQCP